MLPEFAFDFLVALDFVFGDASFEDLLDVGGVVAAELVVLLAGFELFFQQDFLGDSLEEFLRQVLVLFEEFG